MENLYLFTYNNYYNRIVKPKYDNITDYPEPLAVIENLSFNPNDGVSTNQVINYSGDEPDYCIVTDKNNNILSRWFVIEGIRTRQGQYRIELKRDSITDYIDDIKESPAFIEKGILSINDPMIFNKEDMTFNEIKKDQALIYDKTSTPWIIGYTERDIKNEIKDVEATAINAFIDDYDYSDPNVAALFQHNYYKEYIAAQYEIIGQQSFVAPSRYVYTYYTGAIANTESGVLGTDYTGETYLNVPESDVIYDGEFFINPFSLSTSATNEQLQTLGNETIPAALYNNGKQYFFTNEAPADINSYQNKILKDGNHLYRINVVKSQRTTEFAQGKFSEGNPYTGLITVIDNSNSNITKTNNTEIKFATDFYYVWLEKGEELPYVNSYSFVNKESISNPKDTIDAPYQIFAMKYSDNALRFATQIALTLGAKCYDVQILPYFPIQNIIDEEGTGDKINRTDLISNTQYYTISNGNINDADTDIFYLYWCPYANFEVSEFSITSKNSKIKLPMISAVSNIERKINSQCDKLRLCSPNGNGAFDFNLEMNGGLYGFNADCTYKPINPYIHINPIFDLLYGEDFNDYRGVILQGDFSIPQLQSAWVTYEQQNKNYQNIFNRQIENMEVNNAVQRTREKVSMYANAIAGAVGGAATGALLGGGLIGGAIGGLAAGGLSLYAGSQDRILNEKLRTEALDYAHDMYGYNLGNIKAIPNTLTKTGSFNANNPMVPYLEFYTCTDEEKEALRNKIKYNGMTVMKITDKLDNYILNNGSYLKASIIRSDTLISDFHIFKDISDELYKGVFI